MKGEGRTKRKADKLLFIERFCAPSVFLFFSHCVFKSLPQCFFTKKANRKQE